METYSFLRELADSWGLLALTLFFLGVVGWAFRPGSAALHDDIAQIPLRRDGVPLPVSPCSGQCDGCRALHRKALEDRE